MHRGSKWSNYDIRHDIERGIPSKSSCEEPRLTLEPTGQDLLHHFGNVHARLSADPPDQRNFPKVFWKSANGQMGRF